MKVELKEVDFDVFVKLELEQSTRPSRCIDLLVHLPRVLVAGDTNLARRRQE